MTTTFDDLEIKPASHQTAFYQRPVFLLLMAVWFGLAAGFGEAAILAFEKLYLHQIINRSHQILWMAPVADGVLFTLLGLVLFGIASLWPKLPVSRVAIFTFTFLLILSLHFVHPKVQTYAALLLGAGISLQIARVLPAHLKGFYRLLRITTPLMIAILVLLIMGMGVLYP